jgi:hypothetical protein
LQSGISERKLFGRFIICSFNLFVSFCKRQATQKKAINQRKTKKPAKLIVPGKTSKAFKI